jgi:hypothetical protein
VIDEPFKGSEVTDRFMRDNSHNWKKQEVLRCF